MLKLSKTSKKSIKSENGLEMVSCPARPISCHFHDLLYLLTCPSYLTPCNLPTLHTLHTLHYAHAQTSQICARPQCSHSGSLPAGISPFSHLYPSPPLPLPLVPLPSSHSCLPHVIRACRARALLTLLPTPSHSFSISPRAVPVQCVLSASSPPTPSPTRAPARCPPRRFPSIRLSLPPLQPLALPFPVRDGPSPPGGSRCLAGGVCRPGRRRRGRLRRALRERGRSGGGSGGTSASAVEAHGARRPRCWPGQRWRGECGDPGHPAPDDRDADQAHCCPRAAEGRGE